MGIGEQLIGQAGLDDPAVAHDDRAVGQGGDHREVVADDRDGDLAFGEEFGQQIEYAGGHRRIQPGRRFVQQQHLRIDRKCLGNLYALAHATGELPSWHQGVAGVGGRPRVILIGCEQLQPPTEIADQLGPAMCTRLERIAYLDDTVVSFLTEWVPAGVASHLDVGLPVIESLEELLRGLRWQPRRESVRVTVDNPPERARQQLELVDSAPAWQVESLTVDAPSGTPLLFSSNWTRLDMVRFICEL